MANEISFEQFLSQLSSQNCLKMKSEFDIGALNGAVRAMRIAKIEFANNFNNQSFFGERWVQRKNNKWTKWLREHGRNSILKDDGVLFNAVKSASITSQKSTSSQNLVRIEVNPSHLGERRVGSWRWQSQSYAGIHNAPSGTFQYGRTGAPSIQRQFIGHNVALERGRMLNEVCNAILEKPTIARIFK